MWFRDLFVLVYVKIYIYSNLRLEWEKWDTFIIYSVTRFFLCFTSIHGFPEIIFEQVKICWKCDKARHCREACFYLGLWAFMHSFHQVALISQSSIMGSCQCFASCGSAICVPHNCLSRWMNACVDHNLVVITVNKILAAVRRIEKTEDMTPPPPAFIN